MNHPKTDAETIWRELERDARPGTLDDPLDEEEEAAIADEIARADELAADEAREERLRYAWERSTAGQAEERARDDATDWGGFC